MSNHEAKLMKAKTCGKKEEPGFFDLDIDLNEVLSHASVSDIFDVKDLQQRKLFLNYQLTSSEGYMNTSPLINNILQYNADDAGIPPEERKPIKLYISCPGGSVEAGTALMDAIRMSQTPVYTINVGYAYSMAFYLMLCGHKRFAFPNSTFLLHDGSNCLYDSTYKVKDRMEFEERMEQKLKDFVLNRSRITEEEYEKNLRREWYMFPEDAMEHGVVDYIVGENAYLSEVI